jgi:hypothetical protein
LLHLYISEAMQFTDFWIGKIQSDRLPEAIDAAGLIKYLSVYTSDELCFQILFQWQESTLKRNSDWWFPRQDLLKVIHYKINKRGLTDTLRMCLELLDTSEKKNITMAADKVNIQIDILLHGGPTLLISRRDPLGIMIIDFLSNIKSERQRQYWTIFIEHCLNAGENAVPTRRWWNKVKEITAKINADHFIMKLQDWISFAQGYLMATHKEPQPEYADYQIDFLSAINHNMLKAFIWCTAIPDNKVLLDMLESYIPWAYRKCGIAGPLSAKTGTACLYAFTFLPFREAIQRISKFRKIVKHPGTLKSIDKILGKLATEHDIAPYEMEEFIIPDYGLEADGSLRMALGDLTGIYTLQNSGKSVVSWERDGRKLKIMRTHTPATKAFKQLAKEIDNTLLTSIARIERSFLRLRPWTFQHWKTYYLEHPLIRTLTTRLIWNFHSNGTHVAACCLEGQLVDAKGKVMKIAEDAQVTLWHPMMEPAKNVKAWRGFLEGHHISQPFEQVHRQTYTPTADELEDGFYSTRFASHVLNEQRFKTVITQRGWTLNRTAGRGWSYVPHTTLEDWNIRVNLFADRKEEDTVITDVLNFYKEGAPLLLKKVPAVIFSEIIRDVNLFITRAGTAELHNRS